MADALFSASFLNACLRHCEDVGMANIAPIVNTRGPLYVHPKGIVKRTTFHTLAMYANLLEARVAPSSVGRPRWRRATARSRPWDAVATTDAAGSPGPSRWLRHPPAPPAGAVRRRLGGRRLDGRLPGDGPGRRFARRLQRCPEPEPRLRRRKRSSPVFRGGVAELSPHSLTIVKRAAEADGERPRTKLGAPKPQEEEADAMHTRSCSARTAGLRMLSWRCSAPPSRRPRRTSPGCRTWTSAAGKKMTAQFERLSAAPST